MANKNDTGISLRLIFQRAEEEILRFFSNESFGKAIIEINLSQNGVGESKVQMQVNKNLKKTS